MKMNVEIIGEEIFLQEFKDKSFQLLHDLSEAIWSNLVDTTPVDTGSARNSWDIAESEENIKSFEQGLFSTPPSLPSYSDAAENLTIGSRAPYMIYLNEGWSEQAPALFLEIAVEDALSELQ